MKKKAFNCAKYVIIFAILLIVLVSCKPEKRNEVHIGYFNNVTHAQALLMKAKGSLEKELGEDINVEWIAFNAGPAEVEALFAEDIDIGYIGTVPAITANIKSNGEVKILSGATKGGATLISRIGSKVKSVKDLSGRTVAVPQLGNTQHLCLLNLLSDNNMKPKSEGGDVNVVAVANADVGNVIERGDVDAALVPEPWGSMLLGESARLVLDYDSIYLEGDYDVAVVVVRSEFMKENPEIVRKFLEIHKKMTDEINSNRKNAVEVINGEIKSTTGKSISSEVLESAFLRIGVSDNVNKTSVDGFSNMSKDLHFIKELPEEEKLYVVDN